MMLVLRWRDTWKTTRGEVGAWPSQRRWWLDNRLGYLRARCLSLILCNPSLCSVRFKEIDSRMPVMFLVGMTRKLIFCLICPVLIVLWRSGCWKRLLLGRNASTCSMCFSPLWCIFLGARDLVNVAAM